jgi:hypothetical protein
MTIEEFASGALNWEDVSLAEATSLLENIRAELTRATETINRRIELQNSANPVYCANPNCAKVIDVERGRYKGRRDRMNTETGQVESKFVCSEACWLYLQRNWTPFPQKDNHAAPHAAPPADPSNVAATATSAPTSETTSETSEEAQ